MRERLTASFVVVVVLLLAAAALVRVVTLTSDLRAEESEHLHENLALIGQLVEDRRDQGGPVDEAFLSGLVPERTRLEYDDGSDRITVAGDRYSSDEPGQVLAASLSLGSVQLRLTQSSDVVNGLVAYDISSLIILFGLISVLAGLCGYVISRALSSPFRQLAGAAAALGRGRFDLDLPRTRIPEARAIGQALEASATQIQDRLRREQAFSEHASHVLRTPLTGLRLELEELAIQEGLSEESRAAVGRALASAEEVSVVAGELVELNRRGSLVEGSEIPLRDLAIQCAQRWADELDGRGRTVTAGVEGVLEMTYTPGPVEHVMDLVLVDVMARTQGPVRLLFDGGPGGHLRVKIVAESTNGQSAWPSSPPSPFAPEVGNLAGALLPARRLVEVIGGRLEGHPERSELDLLLPRR